MEAKPINTASIAHGLFCKACGWPVIHVCCNDEMGAPPWGNGDWWGYCANKGCKNHEGAAWDQSTPDFAFWEDAAQNAD